MHQPKTVQNLGPWSEMFLLFLTHETHYLASLTLPWSGLIMWSVFSSMETVSFDMPSISHLNIICWLKQIPQVGEITIYLIYLELSQSSGKHPQHPNPVVMDHDDSQATNSPRTPHSTLERPRRRDAEPRADPWRKEWHENHPKSSSLCNMNRYEPTKFVDLWWFLVI